MDIKGGYIKVQVTNGELLDYPHPRSGQLETQHPRPPGYKREWRFRSAFDKGDELSQEGEEKWNN